ncbi:unnamed protein product [Cuscuta campestris]|uniref:Uncharacterized protein n=1 Tax=Cuscuta campestris TaxID=132261 RepID=A0A484KSN4_9ASTE|nr:unnamed protein product [Cuscuta campestris]
MQKAQVHEVRNLMPDGYQLTYRATWKSIIPLHAGTSIGIHYHSIKDLGEFSIHPFKVLFLETYGIMPRQLAPNGHRLLGSFINVCRFLCIPLSLRLFDHMFDVRPGSKETLGFVVVSSHQGRAFLCGLPPSNKRWKDKYVCIKFPPADDLVAWETTLRARDASTRGLYHVGKWSVYPGRETDPDPEIVLTGVIPEAIPISRARGSKALATATAVPSRPAKKKKEKGYDDWKIMMEAHLYALHDCMWMVLEDGPLKIQMENPERNLATPDEATKYPGVWYLDSGCSRHMTGDASLLSNLIPYDGPRVTFGGSNDFGLTKGLGNLVYKGLTIQAVSYVEGLNYNLLSISQFCDKGYSLEFCKDMASLKNISTNEVILTGKRIRNIYEVLWSDVKEACLIRKDKDEEVNKGDRMKPTEFIPFRSLPLKTSQRNPDSDSAEPSGNFGQPSNIPDLSNGDNSGNGNPVPIHPETPTTSVLQPEAELNQPVNPNQHNLLKGKKYEARYWLYYLSSKEENRASASATAEESSSDNVPLINFAKTTKRKHVVSPSPSDEAPQNLAPINLEEEESSDQGELQKKKKRKINSPSTSGNVNPDELKEKEPAEETSAQNRSPQQLEEEIPQVQSLPTSSPQPQIDDADNQFWQLYYGWKAWKVGNSAEQLLNWDQQLKNEKIIKKCLGIPVNHNCEQILDDYWVWQRNPEDLHLEYLANTPVSDFEADDEDPAVFKSIFSKDTEDQVVFTSEAQGVLEAATADFQILPETSHVSEMVLTEVVEEKAASPPQEQNQETADEEEFQPLIQSQVLEILTTPCEISNPTEIEIPEKSAEIPEQSALPETMEQAVEAQRNSGEAAKETQMAELEVSETPVTIFEEENTAEERDSLSRDISNFALEAEGESERTLKVTDEEDVQEDAESLPMQLFQRTPSSHQVTNFHFHNSSTPTLPDEIPEIWTKKVQGLIESALASQHASFRQEIEQMEVRHTQLIEKYEGKHSADLKEISKSVQKTVEIISLLSETVSNTMEIYASDSQLQLKEINKVKEQIASVTVSLQKQMSLLQMDIISALAVASANQVVTKDYLKVIIDNQKEAYKLFRFIGANSGNRKMEVILQQHSPSPIPQLPIAIKEGEVSYIPSHLNLTNLILEAQQRNPEDSAQLLSSLGLDGTEFIGSFDDEEKTVKEKESEEEKTQEQTKLPKEWRTEIISPKIVEPTLFNDVTYAPCKAPFQHQGLLKFISLKYDFYCPNVIRQFYSTLRITLGDSPDLITHIDGKTFTVNAKTLTAILGLRQGEVRGNFDNTFEDKAIWKQLGIPFHRLSYANSSNPSVTNLTLTQRVLQYIFCYVLLPRDSNHGIVNKDDICLFHVLLNDVKFDWVHFFLIALRDGSRLHHLRFAVPIMLILLNSGVDFSRDIRVPVKKTCFIEETKFIRVVCRNEGEMPQRRVNEQEASIHESQAESEATRSNADEGPSNVGEETSRGAMREARRRRPKPRADEPEPSWVRRILDSITCVRNDIRHLSDRVSRLEDSRFSRSYRGPRHSFSGGPKPANSL